MFSAILLIVFYVWEAELFVAIARTVNLFADTILVIINIVFDLLITWDGCSMSIIEDRDINGFWWNVRNIAMYCSRPNRIFYKCSISVDIMWMQAIGLFVALSYTQIY